VRKVVEEAGETGRGKRSSRQVEDGRMSGGRACWPDNDSPGMEAGRRGGRRLDGFTEVVTGTQFLRFVEDLVAAWLAPSNLMEPPVYLVFILNAK